MRALRRSIASASCRCGTEGVAGTGATGAAGFYRHLSSCAADLALSETQIDIRRRCAHSAGVWALIADAIDAGDEAGVARLTANVAYMEKTPAAG